ncbi:MAG: 1-acyl-sn-glycerol-3-phosphate acyltransferase [Bacteroidia bacterium]|nr:1-acyl-sn-glycerol-3-phosphate acyltransferase [Bacteroidia bacterium]
MEKEKMMENPNQAELNRQVMLIDVQKVLADKNPALARIIPGFIVRYLKRIIHQEEINTFLKQHGHLDGLAFVDEVVNMFRPKVTLRGLENLSSDGRFVVASNHPLGGLDGIVLMQAIGKVRPDIQFPVNDILLNIKNLQPLFVPINKHGSNAENIRILNETFEGNAVVCYFPFGLVSRKRKGIIRDLDWKKTFLTKARRYKRDVIPTHISGRNSDFFYRLANLRKTLGIKANLEMLYLVDEFFKQQDQDICITFGKPIPWEFFDRRFNENQWAEKLRGFVYYLAQYPDADFDAGKDYFSMI